MEITFLKYKLVYLLYTVPDSGKIGMSKERLSENGQIILRETYDC